MAIIVKEREKVANWLSPVIWVLVICLIFGLVYFLFFKQPELVEIIQPIELQRASRLANIKFDPSEVIQSEVFKTLQQYAEPPTIGEVGRSNPFIPY